MRRVGGGTLKIGDDVKVIVLGIDDYGKVKFGIEVPADIAVDREEVYQLKKLQRESD